MAAAEPRGAAELPQLAENLLCRLQENFEALTEKLTLRTEEMGKHISDLEKRVADLMTEAGVENSDEDLGVKTFT
ncbi:heat shock factor-binding protein 1-like protein 1 [Taeniopygia guttata]|uniref:heat shock factor-binding protein 1-like protein 1 n=1 Tax=Lonchura striata TaxID=40157 RepID=UPI000B4C7720|nr:heat shock factor-binding protein 1-like protein 1 [Lonchura striata domestica]